MNNILNFANITNSLVGHWKIMPSGKIAYELGELSSDHPHRKLFDQKTDISKLKKILMHGMEAMHDHDGSYAIKGKKISHGKLDELSSIIETYMENSKNSIPSLLAGHKCTTMLFGGSNAKAQYIDDGSKALFVVRDANHYPVACKIEGLSDKKNLEKILLKFISEYIAHEHHRASLAIHGNGIISHAPDHIMFNASPLEYWPVPSENVFFRYPAITSVSLHQELPDS